MADIPTEEEVEKRIERAKNKTKWYNEQDDFEESTYREDGVILWKNSDNPVPLPILVMEGYEGGELFRLARNFMIEKSKQLEKDRERMKNREITPEQRCEMEAAFGKGETVVNVLTGETTEL